MVGRIPESPTRYRRLLAGAPFIALMLGGAWCFPSMIAYLTGASSHATGLALGCGVTLAVLAPVMQVRVRYDLIAAVLGFLVIHFFVARQLGATSMGRFAGSCALLALVIVTMQYTAQWLAGLPTANLERALSWLAIFFLIVTLFSALRLQPPGGPSTNWEKPTFPFTEPSHFATSFTPILLVMCAQPGKMHRLIWLMLGMLVGVFLQNLTIFLGVLLVMLITAPLWQFAIVASLVLVAVTQVDLTYYLSRLDFSSNTDNLSTLVYLQGMDFLREATKRTWGWGLGFQQLGFTPLYSPASLVIYAKNSSTFLNLQDGGFVGTKIVSELGLFGVVAVLLETLYAVRSAIVLRITVMGRSVLTPAQRLCFSIIVAYIIDIYARGVGYFSGTTFMLGVAFFTLAYLRQPGSRPRTALGSSHGVQPSWRRA